MKTGRKFWASIFVFCISTALLYVTKIDQATWENVTAYTLLFFGPTNVAEHLITNWGSPWAKKTKVG